MLAFCQVNVLNEYDDDDDAETVGSEIWANWGEKL